MRLSRRRFLAGFPVALTGGTIAWGRTARTALHLRIALIEEDEPGVSQDQRLRGVTLGIEEGRKTLALFGRSLAFERTRSDAPGIEGFQALLGGTALQHVTRSGTILLNLDSASAIRLHCSPLLFHVSTRPDQRGELWDSSLRMYGAGQLNDRFRHRYGLPMNGDAWAGWFAVKILVEASLKGASSESQILRAGLADGDARFDGHKGAALRFTARTQELVQPLYVRDASGSIEVIPPHAGEISQTDCR